MMIYDSQIAEVLNNIKQLDPTKEEVNNFLEIQGLLYAEDNKCQDQENVQIVEDAVDFVNHFAKVHKHEGRELESLFT